MNPLSPQLKQGTIGELLVQVRLLQYDIQAVSPHKDTGNDLLAVRGETFRAVQVKSFAGDVCQFNQRKLMVRRFHVLALVQLEGEDRTVFLDRSRIFLLKKDEVSKGRFVADELEPYELTKRVAELFP
jgi:hypothetical protein